MGLDIYEVVLEVEKEFGTTIKHADMQQIESVGDLFNATIKALRQEHPERFVSEPSCTDEVWEQLKVLLMHQLGLKPAQIVKSARFFDELGFP